VSGWAPALDTDPVALLEMYNINVVGPLRVTQHFSDLLVSTANSRTLGAGRSVVLNVTSVARYGTAWQCGYSSSKVCPISEPVHE
jgi:NAD(P)-dependent dehydrogenase (short-subunit alcohol dehydrogenase family)